MSEQHELVLRPDPGNRPPGLLAKILVDVRQIVVRLRPTATAEELRDQGVRYVSAKTDVEAGRASRIQAIAIAKMREIDHNKQKLRDDRQLHSRQHKRDMVELDIKKRAEMASFIKDLLAQNVTLDIALITAKEVFDVRDSDKM